MNSFSKRNEIVGHLAGIGFQRERDGTYRRRKLSLRRDRGWFILTDSGTADRADPLTRHARLTGPWKPVTGSDKPCWTAEFPAAALETVPNGDEAKPALIQWVDWAVESANVRPASTSDAPSEAEVQSWVSGAGLTILSHQHVRQVTLQRDDHRLVLSVPIVTQVPAGLPETRNTWLRDLLLATQDRWRMVRVVDESNGPARTAVAEIDLTGAPHQILEPLFAAGLQSLRYAVQWSIQSADLLVDLGVTCRAMEVRQPTT